MTGAADGTIRRTSFVVFGAPVSWKRAERGVGRSYTDPAVKAYQRAVRAAALEAGANRLARGEVRATCRFYRAGVPRSCMSAGDADNLTKGVLDALSGVCWEDDSVVVDERGMKFRDDNDPRTEVELEVVGELPEVSKRARREQEAAKVRRLSDLRRLLAPKDRERLVKKRLVPSLRRWAP